VGVHRLRYELTQGVGAGAHGHHADAVEPLLLLIAIYLAA
jgi:hypothetical protein